MKKINLILGFKKSIFFVIPLLITSCGVDYFRNNISEATFEAIDGTKINFKKENVNCKWDKNWSRKNYRFSDKTDKTIDVVLWEKDLRCSAYGVATQLNGTKLNYRGTDICKTVVKNEKLYTYKDYGSNIDKTEPPFPCKVGYKFRQHCVKFPLKVRIFDGDPCVVDSPDDLQEDGILFAQIGWESVYFLKPECNPRIKNTMWFLEPCEL